jgi:hypothetical protein
VTVRGVMVRSRASRKKSSRRVGWASRQAGWAAQASNIAVRPEAAEGQKLSMVLACGGTTESSTTLRMPSGWSRRVCSARSVP